MAEVQSTLVTKEGLEKMKAELDHLRSVERAEVAQRLKEAIAMGDLNIDGLRKNVLCAGGSHVHAVFH